MDFDFWELQSSHQSSTLIGMNIAALNLGYARNLIKPSDLSIRAGKKRQSPRTGFVHVFYGSDEASDTIATYENICFALALLLQRKAETVLEAKQLLLKLLAFQSDEGNFPIYLHDFPLCYDPYLGLKIAPVFLRVLEHFGSVIGLECKEKIERSLKKIFSCIEKNKESRSLASLWEFRFQVCRSVFEKKSLEITSLSTDGFSASDWWEYWLSLQFIQTSECSFYHAGLQKSLGPFLMTSSQDQFEPKLELIDLICAEKLDEPLLTDRALHIQLSAMDCIKSLPLNLETSGYLTHIGPFHALFAVEKTDPSPLPLLQFLWKNEKLHSARLEAPSCFVVSEMQGESLFMKIDLPTVFAFQRDALFEISFFVDASPDIKSFIQGKKATCFYLGEELSIHSLSWQMNLSFELLEGEGDFCGHLFRSNRSNQKATTGALQYQSFDWKIALRTLRRSEKCSIGFRLSWSYCKDGQE